LNASGVVPIELISADMVRDTLPIKEERGEIGATR
jgi:hypothetical protein